MKKIYCFIFLQLCINFYQISYASAWTPEEAREKAFSSIQSRVDISGYPSKDPNFEENQQALKDNKEMVGDRFITANDDPLIAYVVSKLDKQGRPLVTMFYGKDGHLNGVRLFSNIDYPKSAYIYCMQDECNTGKNKYGVGDLMSVSFHPSEREVFYFSPDRQLDAHIKD